MTTEIASKMLTGIAFFPAISLSELQTEAEYLTRRDRKYLVPAADAAAMLAGIDPNSQVLEIDGGRSFGYLTPYFDDDQFSAYLLAARGRPDRFKVRTRLYTESGLCMLELKVRDGRGMTVKHRMEHDAGALERLESEDRGWLRCFPQIEPFAGGVRHQMTTFYRRFTLVLPEGHGRVTVDRDLAFGLPDGRGLSISSYVIIETKGAGAATSFDRLLWANGHRPMPISKFAAGLSLLKPELPKNRWHRIHAQLAAAAEDRTDFKSGQSVGSRLHDGIMLIS